MEKPAYIFDRDDEWRALVQFATNDAPGATLGIVYGRRRQGKTFLLDALCRTFGGFYFAATEATAAESLARLNAEVTAQLGLPPAQGFADWYQAVDWLLALGRDRSLPVVIDEFPYLVTADPSLPSIIQRALTANRPERLRSRTRLLLCGSAMSFMGRLLTGSAPLRGRAELELVVPALDYRLAARFWEITDARLAVLTHSVVGGTPAYRTDFVRSDSPRSLADFDSWVVRNALNRNSPLFREARHLLAEEPNLRDTGLYHSVLAGIALGNRTRGGIASFIGRKVSDLAHPLTVLEDAGLVVRQEDAFRAARTTFAVAEPLVAFYHAVMRPEWSRLDRPGQAAQVWAQSSDRFRTNVLGPHFEHLCREWTLLYAGPQVFGGPVSKVGRGVVSDASQRTGYEVDVVVQGFATSARRPLLAIGEAKWGEVIGVSQVERLRQLRQLLRGRPDLDATATKLACFSAAGFTTELTRAAEKADDIILIDLDQLYAEPAA